MKDEVADAWKVERHECVTGRNSARSLLVHCKLGGFNKAPSVLGLTLEATRTDFKDAQRMHHVHKTVTMS